MKGKIIILLSLLLIAMSSYSYAGDCYYYPGSGISLAEFYDGKCSPEQVKAVAAHQPKEVKTNRTSRYTSRRQNHALTNRGFYVGVVKQRQSDGRMLYQYKINLPCFFTAPGNTPCKRGRFGR